jgi:Immunoglobulin V-set domain
MLLILLTIVVHVSYASSPIHVREHVNVTLTCQFHLTRTSSIGNNNGYTWNRIYPIDHVILWYKDDTQVIGVNLVSNDPTRYVIVQLDYRTFQLTIIDVQLESSGVYKCQNFTAKEENRFQLHVIGRETSIERNHMSSLT